MKIASTEAGQPTRSGQFAVAAAPALVFGFLLFFEHLAVLSLPYFWDELGQFVPAALDILRDGAWIPRTTLPNIHPPGVMAYLALVWRVFGYSITATRCAMLLLADLGLVAVFLLSIELCKPLRGMPAFFPPLLLLAAPLFFTQSMMAQLDMPAMVFTVLVLLLFFKNRVVLASAASVALVLSKETGILVPFILALFLLRDRRVKDAMWFLLPAAALAVWLTFLAAHTGTIFGNREFQHYNVGFQFHPVRFTLTLLRRFFYLGIENFQWIGVAAIVYAWRKTAIFRTRPWTVVAAVGFAHILLVSILGGAALERYLMPVLPLLYIAIAAAWTTLPPRWQFWSQIAMPAALFASLFLNPPWPYPYEDNLAVVDFVRLQESAAELVQASYPAATVASAWPFPDALRRPEFGYVVRPMKVIGLEDFHRASVLAVKDKADVLVVYSRTWEPETSILHLSWVTDFLRRYYFYEPQITSEEIQTNLGLQPVGTYTRRGQWITVYARQMPGPGIMVQR